MTDFIFTLAEARKWRACFGGYNKVVCYLKGCEFVEQDEYITHDSVVSVLDVLESNGFDDAIWALRCVKGKDRDIRLFAVWCARQVQHLMKDQRSIDALDVAEKYANGKATYQELQAARDATWAATWDAASAAARDVTWDSAWDAASAAAWDAAKAASRAAQKEMLIKMCNGQAPWQVEK